MLSPPTLVSPPDNTVTADNTPTFGWDNAYVADNYELWVDSDSNFSSPVILKNTTENSYTVAELGLADGTYYWRARAYKGENISDFSSTWNLIVSVSDFIISVSPASASVQQRGAGLQQRSL